MLQRKMYTDRIMQYTDKPVVKILTGVKRAGKSTLLQLVAEELQQRGVQKKNIVTMSFEGMESSQTDYQTLTAELAARATPGEKLYIFLDEIQRVHGWEKTALHLMHDVDADVYVTGSNDSIASKNVLAVLEDRNRVFEIAPLSFTEYLEFRGDYTVTEETSRELVRYLMTGGFPSLHRRAHTQSEAYAYMRDVMNAALWTDIVGLGQLRRADQLERVIRFVFENLGRTFSAKHLSDSLRGENREINIETVYTYLERLETSYLISRCSRFDLNTDEPLKTQEKFYLADPALRFSMLGFKPNAVTAGLENIVYLEFKRRGYDVYMGKLGRREIDFVAIDGDRRVYAQLGRELRGEEGNDYSRLSAIRDNHPKYILTSDASAVGNRNGIRTVTIADFLLGRAD